MAKIKTSSVVELIGEANRDGERPTAEALRGLLVASLSPVESRTYWWLQEAQGPVTALQAAEALCCSPPMANKVLVGLQRLDLVSRERLEGNGRREPLYEWRIRPLGG